MDDTLRIPTTVRMNLAQRLLRDSAYSLSALPIGILTFTVVVTGLAAGAGLFVVWVGLPVLVGTVLLARAFAHLERLRLRSLQVREVSLPSYRSAATGSNALRRLLTPLRDPQSWLDAVWGVVGFFTGLVAFVVTVAWWSVTAAGLTYWIWERWIPEGDDDKTLAELIGLGEGRTPDIWLNLAIGAVALLLLPAMVRGVAVLHAGTADALLNGRARLQR
jgi:putative sensor protein